MSEIFDNMFEFISHGENVVFMVLAVVMIISAVLMISFTKVVHMVVSLAMVFLSMAGIYILLDAEFVAVVQVLIYAGAISILMIFGIMMTKHGQMEEEPKRPTFSLVLLIGILVLFGVIFYAIQDTTFTPTTGLEQVADNTKAIGELIYNNYVIPFELVSVLLTVAFIGAIVLAKREEE